MTPQDSTTPGQPPLTSYTRKLTPQQADCLEKLLLQRNFIPLKVPHARFAAEKENVKVIFYESGKLLVQGKGTREFVEFILEPEILGQAELGYEEILQPEKLLPRIGVDESGKGDFFGPLCVAGVYINADVALAWKNSGIRDSKDIGSDNKISELAKIIRQTPGCVNKVVVIGPEAYNRLHQSMGSVNKILAWGHARVIENLMLLHHRMNPPPLLAISDQFAKNKETVAQALMSLGRQIELVQRHKAESDLAVAAASILARDEFVKRLAQLGKSYGMAFPKGASNKVEEVGRQFVAKFGEAELPKVAKMHFRTSHVVRGLPPPPKTIFKPNPSKPDASP